MTNFSSKKNSSSKPNNYSNVSNDKVTEAEQKSLSKFNSVTQKVKPENQNQTHNVRLEGTSKINQNR